MWTEPKTDWQPDDRFNYSDYNRIKNNILYLKNMAEELYLPFAFEDMGYDKTSHENYIYADEITAMEDNIEALRENTFLFDASETKSWHPNQTAFNYEDANRIEQACLNFYNGFINQSRLKRRLSFRLGTKGFGDVSRDKVIEVQYMVTEDSSENQTNYIASDSGERIITENSSMDKGGELSE